MPGRPETTFMWGFPKKVRDRGLIYAADKDKESLRYIDEPAKKRGLANIKTVKVSKNPPDIGKKVDLVFLRNVYHHLDNRKEYFRKVRHKLKKQKRLAIVDRMERVCFHKTLGHYVKKGHNNPGNGR